MNLKRVIELLKNIAYIHLEDVGAIADMPEYSEICEFLEGLPDIYLESIDQSLFDIKRLLAIYILATSHINPPHLEFVQAVARGME